MFEGFSQEALDFLNDIRFNNNQAFYAANQARYERFVKRPMRELSDELAPVVQLIDPKLDTRPGRTMSRIRRDTRYTKDKSPFRDHAWLGWRYPGEGRGEGFHMYWGFGPDWLGWGCGCYYPDKPLMDALRLHIRKEADDVRRCLRALDGRFEMYGEDYKKLAVPADVPEDLREGDLKVKVLEHAGGLGALAHARHGGRDCRRSLADGAAASVDAPDARRSGACRAGSRSRAGGKGARRGADGRGKARKAGRSLGG